MYKSDSATTGLQSHIVDMILSRRGIDEISVVRVLVHLLLPWVYTLQGYI